MLIIVMAVITAALLILGENAYAFDGPGNPHWDKTKAVWNSGKDKVTVQIKAAGKYLTYPPLTKR